MLNKIIKKFRKTETDIDELSEQLSRDRAQIQGQHNALITSLIEQQEALERVAEGFRGYLDELLDWVQTSDDEIDTLNASIERARECGVSEDKILHNELEGMKFFMS